MNSDFFNDLIKRTGYGLKQFLKAMLISSIINFIVLLIGLRIANVPNYGLVALGIAVADLLPVIGAGIILIPWAIIALVSGNGTLAATLIVIYIITFILKQILEPIILGKSIGLKPLYTLGITVVSMIVLTPGIGAIVGAIISIVLGAYLDIKETRKYRNL